MSSIHRSRARSVALPVAITLAVEIGLTVLAFFALRSREFSSVIKVIFERDAQDHISAIQNQTNDAIESLMHLRGMYNASEYVSRSEFSLFASTLILDYPGTQALEWIPRVLHAERLAFERAAEADGLIGFRITERSPEGETVPASARDEYFPVSYIEPVEGNELAIGFDLASNPTRLEALSQAWDTGEPIATARTTLVQEVGQQHGFLLFLPVYSDGSEASTPE